MPPRLFGPSDSGTLAPSHLHTLAPLILCLLGLCLLPVLVTTQESTDGQRITDRIRALEREAEQLAGEARTLVGDLRRREIDRQIKAGQLKEAQTALAEAEKAVQDGTNRLAELEVQRVRQLPDLEKQLVDMYKHGRSGYLRLLFSAGDFREFGRATRAIGALSALDQRRIEEHRRTLQAMREERERLEQTAAALQGRAADARRAKAAADAAVASATELIEQIDARRDLTAQYVGELQVAYTRLQQQVDALSTDKPAAVPLRPFQGALDWPVEGRTVGAFGQSSNRLGGTAVRNGIEIAAEEGARVRAVHGGSVGYAGPFTGFGTVVILDHGGHGYSLYGYLASTALQQGAAVETGAEVGQVGLAPAGPPTLYFEMRIDGRSVNPLQWLKPR